MTTSRATLVPVELKQRQQWVCWRREERDGKLTKVPYRADGAGKASTTDAATWASFEAANRAYSAGGYDGIGFVFTEADPFTGIDLDHCRDSQTGEIEAWAKTIIDSLRSYTEITPSNTGVHIIVEAKLAPGGNRKDKLEFYDRGRYFTITGAHLEGTPVTIEKRQSELADLHARTFPKAAPINKPGGNGSHPVDLADTELLAKAMSAANGAAFSRLWRSDTSAHGGDDSAADLALCCHLAFWTGNDPARMDALFRQSGLYRPKWEREDYRDRTIARAIETTRETYAHSKREAGGDGKAGAEAPDEGLPEVIVSNRQLRAKTADALHAMYTANDPPKVFTRGAKPVRISCDEHGQPFVDTFTESAFRGRMARTANYIRHTKEGDRVAMAPPLEVVRDALGLPVEDWRFPPLENITEAPTIRPDGSVLHEPGYDEATGLYYIPSPDLHLPAIPAYPSMEDVQAAMAVLLDLIADFPFDGEPSKANALATIMTPPLRPLIPGQVPLALFTKPQAGTGATYLARIVNIIATGRDAALMPAPASNEEWGKVITTTILKGQTIMVVDNVEGRLQSAALSTLLTASIWKGRILGRSDEVTYPNRVMAIATGNNLQLGGDLPRRTVWVRMDAHRARPWQRDHHSFRHPDIFEWVQDNRGVLLAAILTIGRAWVVAGKPVPSNLPALGGYESYSRTLGGALALMGVPGFLGNLSAMYDEVDETTPAWMAFLETWQTELGERGNHTSVDLVTKLNENAALKAALPDWLADMSVRNYQRKLGNALAKVKDVQFPNGLMVVKAGDYHRAACWRVVRQGVSPESAENPVLVSNVSPCESATTQAHKETGEFLYGPGVAEDSHGLTSGTKKCES